VTTRLSSAAVLLTAADVEDAKDPEAAAVPGRTSSATTVAAATRAPRRMIARLRVPSRSCVAASGAARPTYTEKFFLKRSIYRMCYMTFL